MVKPCGTHAAYRRHQRNGEEPCDDCRKGAARYERERRRKVGRPSRATWGRPRCGTTAAYQQHRREGSEPCPSCLEAWAEWHRHYRKGEMIHRRHESPRMGDTILDVLETRGYPMAYDLVADLVVELHPEWSPTSAHKVLYRLKQDGKVETVERAGQLLWRIP